MNENKAGIKDYIQCKSLERQEYNFYVENSYYTFSYLVQTQVVKYV